METLMPTKEKESDTESFDGQVMGITLAENSLKLQEMDFVNTFYTQSSWVNCTGLYTWK